MLQTTTDAGTILLLAVKFGACNNARPEYAVDINVDGRQWEEGARGCKYAHALALALAKLVCSWRKSWRHWRRGTVSGKSKGKRRTTACQQLTHRRPPLTKMYSTQQNPSPHPIQGLPSENSGTLPVVPLERVKDAPGRVAATASASVHRNQ